MCERCGLQETKVFIWIYKNQIHLFSFSSLLFLFCAFKLKLCTLKSNIYSTFRLYSFFYLCYGHTRGTRGGWRPKLLQPFTINLWSPWLLRQTLIFKGTLVHHDGDKTAITWSQSAVSLLSVDNWMHLGNYSWCVCDRRVIKCSKSAKIANLFYLLQTCCCPHAQRFKLTTYIQSTAKILNLSNRNWQIPPKLVT